MSRIGVKPVEIPDAVKVNVSDSTVLCEGPKGKLTYKYSPRVVVEVKDKKITVTRKSDTKIDKSLHGLTRALIANMIKGVKDGYQEDLEIVGVGFRAQVQGKVLNIQLGFSHPATYNIPDGLTIETPKPNQIIIKGIDKVLVGQAAASIRAIFPPEPYKGKGIRYVGERVKKKIGKAVTK